MTEQGKTALVIGATGNIGGALSQALLKRGWRIRALTRDPAAAKAKSTLSGAVEWVAGDAMNPADAVGAADGVAIVVHGAHPPGYRDWEKLSLPMLESTIAAAAASGARIVFPGTIYNYGPDAFPLLAETSPQNPTTRKGKVRVTLERRLEQAAESGVRSLIVRAGDFFGPVTGQNWLAGGMVKPGKPLHSAYDPGRPGTGHAWAYLPDLAETMARLIAREDELPAFATFHFGGHWMDDGREMAETIVRVSGNPRARVRSFPWWAMTLAAPFVTLAYELREMRYLWNEPLRLDNTKLVAFLGEEPHTPLDAAVEATLAGLGCLRAANEPPRITDEAV